jgi:hypothetical protein
MLQEGYGAFFDHCGMTTRASATVLRLWRSGKSQVLNTFSRILLLQKSTLKMETRVLQNVGNQELDHTVS